MNFALDLGSSEFRSLWKQDQRLIARRVPAVYTVIDDLPAHRRYLDQSQVTYSVAGGSLIVVGEAAYEISTILARPVVPVLQEGQLPAQDPVARQVSAGMVESLLPPGERDEACYVVLPRGDRALHEPAAETARFFDHLVQLRGYRSVLSSPSSALAFAELEGDEFTGACLTIGAEAITFSVTHLSQPILEGRVFKGSREVLERFAHAKKRYLWDHAGNSYLNWSDIRSWLLQGDISLAAPRSEDERWLADAYEELLLSAWFSLKRKLARSEHPILRQSLPLVIAGGACQLTGMMNLVAESLKLSGAPLRVRELRLASFEPYSVARGLLIQGAAEAPVERRLAVGAA